MSEPHPHIELLLTEIEELKTKLFESTSIIDSIKEGEIDALVVNRGGNPSIYSLESADYTYRILIEKFGEGALSISDEGLILYCNEYFSKLINIPAKQLIGTYFYEYVDSQEQFHRLLKDLRKGPCKEEILLQVNDKKWPVYLSLTNLNPTVCAIGVVVTDLSEKKKHEEMLVSHKQQLELKVNELNQINKSLEEFIHVISHDLKEPLRKLLTYSSHFDNHDGELLNPVDIKYLRVIQASAFRLNSLVDDLVKYSFSSYKLNANETDLNEVIQEVLDDLELVIAENSALIKTDILPKMKVSKPQMHQLFSNLLMNAIKYKRPDELPKIHINVEVIAGDHLKINGKRFYKISIHDNGIGMEGAHLSKIFTIFQRLHKKDEYSGNGIGLAICKKIMENHGGAIQVESTINKGSVFNLYFPIEK